ncbi:MAG: glycoside hydrolase family 99-like domain-containing protein [Dysgonomonas sp.]|nr:glycoside hydrolase family 99-like domain-containing protein [Dysgonomonas sp.]
MNKKARVIALYLPQFHPIPENDEWWGKGFTEWTNVGKAKPLFKGHNQPRVPADLGYYDLRVPETRKAQADMARQYGIEGFCYWHYWFGNGRRLLERPFNDVLESGDPDFPFCLAWANESWKGFAHGLTNRNMLIEQLYPGVLDYTDHFYEVLPAFKDRRYIQIEGKPVFMIYKPLAHPDIEIFIETWQGLAKKNGLEGIYFLGHNNDPNNQVDQILQLGFNAVNTVRLHDFMYKRRSFAQKIQDKFNKTFRNIPYVYPYKLTSKYFIDEDVDSRENVFPSIISGWDHTPRSGKEGVVMQNMTPELFGEHVKKVMSVISQKQHKNRVVIIKSWNEWAEGNYLEPDLKYGTAFLDVLKKNIE